MYRKRYPTRDTLREASHADSRDSVVESTAPALQTSLRSVAPLTDIESLKRKKRALRQTAQEAQWAEHRQHQKRSRLDIRSTETGQDHPKRTLQDVAGAHSVVGDARPHFALRKLWGTPFKAKKDEQEQTEFEDMLEEHTSGSSHETSKLALNEDARGAEAPRSSKPASGSKEDGSMDWPQSDLDDLKPEVHKAASGQRAPSEPSRDAPVGLHGKNSRQSSTTYRNEQPQAPRIARTFAHTPPSAFSQPSTGLGPLIPLPYNGRPTLRAYHTAVRRAQQATAAVAEGLDIPPDMLTPPPPAKKPESRIRRDLRKWQELHGDEDPFRHTDALLAAAHDSGEIQNTFTRLGENNFSDPASEQDEEREAQAAFAAQDSEDVDGEELASRYLQMGDLVELEFPFSERESLLAIFVRRIGVESQFYTMQGKWVHHTERSVQYSIPGWVSPDSVRPLLEHLPSEQDLDDYEELTNKAYLYDLSVPRHVAAPLVSRMVQFHTESQEIYRKHASTLDNAHNILAHETDLRYGSLVSAATTLLKTTPERLPLPALFTVRKALTHAGFAFNIDRRSHRLTGYLQIRSKEQVKTVNQVRDWMREWQDDLAATSIMSEKEKEKHRSPKGAIYVQRFLEKAKNIILKSRETREPAHYGNVGPSKVKRKITPEQDSVKITTHLQFNDHDQELVRFMEAWAASGMFLGLPRFEALPPLLLQATGLYEDHSMAHQTGFLFLQELGTVLPYENRVRFDQHLLLPSSQHSKPLQNLMSTLLDMQDKHNFSDSMRDLRHDWKGLPVYCVDDASAHEIDDGISIEKASSGIAEGTGEEWWVHIHIANPTAFFSRDHPLAKMARHMGESIYMPERAYMMLPRWATQRHFSLAPERPCLTFSARLNAEGEMLEKKVTPGFIRNVMRLTPGEVKSLVGHGNGQEDVDSGELVLTVGGDPPPPRKRKSAVDNMTEVNISELKTLQMLAEKRKTFREKAGGLFFDSHKPDVNVWQSWKTPGLAWDHPHRRGSRIVEGDPVIQLKTQGLQNWFAAGNNETDVMVREMMLLSCEVAAAWCADRQIPAIFRGTVKHRDLPDQEEYYRRVCEPAMAKNDGVMPMHLGVNFITYGGSITLSTKPMKHRMLGLDHYGKVTSPLRRYGDMILHWQIEAALREEAFTGKSLVSDDRSADRTFLPFSAPVLNTIMLGLRPREGIIMRAKSYAQTFWATMLLFRAFHFGESTGTVPIPKTCNVYVYAKPQSAYNIVSGTMVELNLQVMIQRPERLGTGLEAVREGDTWECEIDHVDVYKRATYVKPLRLVDRWEG